MNFILTVEYVLSKFTKNIGNISIADLIFANYND